MRTWIAFAVAVAVSGVPVPCGGQELEISPEIIALTKGTPAPFAGLLVPQKEYTQLMEAELELRDIRARFRACQRESGALEMMYQNRLKTATRPLSWYETASFSRWFGFTLGVATAAAAVWGASNLTKR